MKFKIIGFFKRVIVWTEKREYEFSRLGRSKFFAAKKYHHEFGPAYVWWKFGLYISDMDAESSQGACPYCHGEVQHWGEDGISYCADGCGCIEGEGEVYLTYRELLKEGLV